METTNNTNNNIEMKRVNGVGYVQVIPQNIIFPPSITKSEIDSKLENEGLEYEALEYEDLEKIFPSEISSDEMIKMSQEKQIFKKDNMIIESKTLLPHQYYWDEFNVSKNNVVNELKSLRKIE